MNSPEAKLHQEAFIRHFIVKDRQDRLFFEIANRRVDFLGRFSHNALLHLDSRFVFALKKPNSDPQKIFQSLREKGAGKECYAMSFNDSIDGRFMPLSEALSAAIGFGNPTILSCRLGALAYLETEQETGPPDRFILYDPNAPAR